MLPTNHVVALTLGLQMRLVATRPEFKFNVLTNIAFRRRLENCSIGEVGSDDFD